MTDFRLTTTTLPRLGALVRERRRAARLSLDDAAALIGVGRRLLVEFELGRRGVNARTLLRVLEAFGRDVVVRPRGAVREPDRRDDDGRRPRKGP